MMREGDYRNKQIIGNQSFLQDFFDEFFAVLVVQKQRAVISAQRPDVSERVGGNSAELVVEAIASELSKVLEKQHFFVMRHGGEYALSLYREVEYIMVALADELLLNLSWPGLRLWEQKILENRLFNTHVAGELIFTRIEELLTNKDAERADIARIYLLALGLGFKGKLRDDPDQLSIYKRRLFLFINHAYPHLQDENFKLFPMAYQNTLEDSLIKKLPNPHVWHSILLLTMFCVLFLSYGYWYRATKEASLIVDTVLKVSGAEGK